ncbi:V-type ATP synthase subunit C [Proteiniclasticum sp. BAD-10]|uniref:V-type ATP synthase subunit C n=1 Tax=Proteiniclasticum sediminis TaxID=2804028 RepID=A0A941CR70_9CLOT|nr:V-type ATP synthase subunit C [Proteiniclasticum sediminis]MBR0575826.1 V-type ATP synthase subunit C [Proteiniclasticum sediminis]
MNRMDFSQAVIRVKVLEKRLLSKARLERMVDAKDMGEVLKILAETEYQPLLGSLERPEDYERILSGEMTRVYALMAELTPEHVIAQLLALKYDYHNLKVLLKEKILGKNLQNLLVSYGMVEISKLRSAVTLGDAEGIAQPMAEAIAQVEAHYEKNADPQFIDILLDRYYYLHLQELAQGTQILLFTDYVRNLIDFTNLKTLIRVKKMEKDIKFLEEVLLDGGNIGKEKILYSLNDSLDVILTRFKNEKLAKPLTEGLEAFRKTGRLTDFEKIMDNALMALQEPSKNIIFGPEPLFSYLYAKEAEIKALRIIMVSKINKLSPSVIRERLRDLYV